MKIGKTKQIAGIFVIIALSLGVIQALSTPVFGSVAVRMSNDDTINTSIAVLESNIEDLKIIDYNTLEFAIEISRNIGPVIWVGHGNPDGIEAEDTSISWNDFSKNIKRTPTSDYVLSCYSSNLIEKTSLSVDDAITFEGEIDGTLGALLVAFRCAPSMTIVEGVYSHLNALQNEQISYAPLGMVIDDPYVPPPPTTPPPPPPPPPIVLANPDIPGAGFTAGELVVHIAVILLIIITFIAISAAAIIRTATLAHAFMLTTIAAVTNLIANIMCVVVDYRNDDSSPLEFAGDLITLIPAIAEVCAIFLVRISIFLSIAFTGTFALESATKIACPAVWVVTLLIAIGLVLYEIDNAIKDWED